MVESISELINLINRYKKLDKSHPDGERKDVQFMLHHILIEVIRCFVLNVEK